MANPVKLAQVEGQGCYPIDVSSADADLTAPAGPTGGYAVRQLYVTGAGDVKFKGIDGATDTLTVAAKTFVPVPMQFIFQTGTTATGLHGVL